MKQLQFEMNVPFFLTKDGKANRYIPVVASNDNGKIHLVFIFCSCALTSLRPDSFEKLNTLAMGIAKQKFAEAEKSSSFINPNGELCMS